MKMLQLTPRPTFQTALMTMLVTVVIGMARLEVYHRSSFESKKTEQLDHRYVMMTTLSFYSSVCRADSDNYMIIGVLNE